MWLINTTTLNLSEFQGGPPASEYAILSHTWADGEVSFHDMTDLAQASKRPGFSKIRKTCEIALASGIEWAWVDTCCIDKSSSAELTESINSMFRFYNEAAICYAYLSDLTLRRGSNKTEGSLSIAYEVTAEELGQCRWFSRGWTLQELVASKHITFFDKDWNDVGSKATLVTSLASITGIDIDVLSDPSAVYQVPVSRRMSWAARRQTKREEDRAYSLFGIFDVNLPLIYGEGRKAFLRLQEAILQKSTDLSLFAWESTEDDTQEFRGLFANSPDEFMDGGCLRPMWDAAIQQTEVRSSNKGIRFKPDVMLVSHRQLERMCPEDTPSAMSVWSDRSTSRSYSFDRKQDFVPEALVPRDRKAFLMKLHHYWVPPHAATSDIDPNNYSYVCVELFRTPDSFVRRKRWILHWNMGTKPKISDKIEVYVPPHLSPQQSRSVIQEADHTFAISCDSPCGALITTGFPRHLWYWETSTFCTKGQDGFVGMVGVKQKPDGDWAVFPRKDGSERPRKWHYPEFRVFFGLTRRNKTPGSSSSSSASSSSSPSQTDAWVYIPTRADLLLGRSNSWGGYSQSDVDHPEGLRHLIRRSWYPNSYKYYPYEHAGIRQASIISDRKSTSGWLLLRAEYEDCDGMNAKDEVKALAPMSLEIQATVKSHRFLSGMTEHRLEILARPAWDRFDDASIFSGPGDMRLEYLSLI